MQTHQPHDKFFKGIMQLLGIVKDLLQGTLDPSMQVLVRKGTISPYKAEFLSSSLKESFADVTFRIQLPGGLMVDVVVLFEHKSYLPKAGIGSNNKSILLQLLEYMVGIWDLNYKQKTGYQLLLPIIFYQGQQAWSYDDIREEMFGKAPEGLDDEMAEAWKKLQRFQPGFEYILVNLHEYTDERIKATFTDGMLKASLMAMRDYALGEPVEDISRYFSNLQGVEVGTLSADFMEKLAKYILALNKGNQENDILKQMKEQAYKIHPSDEPGFVSALDTYNMRVEKAERAAEEAARKADQRAYQEKLEMAKKLKEAGVLPQIISSSTGLSEVVIQGL